MFSTQVNTVFIKKYKLIHEMFMYMLKRLYQTPITGMQKHEVFTKIVYFEVSIEELLLLVVEREFDLEGKWKQGGEAAP